MSLDDKKVLARLAEVEALATAPARNGRHGKDGRDGRDGKDGRHGQNGIGIPGRDGKGGADGHTPTPEEVLSIVAPEVARAVDAIPKPKDGADGHTPTDAEVSAIVVPEVARAVAEIPRPRDGKDGKVGKDGLAGPRGPEGPIGPMPAHRWDGTELQFEQAPGGTWGPKVDLQGPTGPAGKSPRQPWGGGGGAVTGGEGGVAVSVDGAGSQSTGTVIFSNSPSFSFGLAGNVITGSVAGSVIGVSAVNFSAGTTSNNRTDVVFADGNGVTFGLNNGTVTATVQTNYLTTGMASNAATSFANGNGVTFGLAGSTITASVRTDYLTTAMASNAATISNVKISAGSQSSNLSALTFSNANGVTFGLDAGTITASVNAGGGAGSLNLSAGSTSNNLTAVTFADGNGVTFGLNGSVITATVKTDYLTTAMQSASSSNFAATGFTTTATAGAVVVGTHNTDGLKLGVPAFLTTGMQSNAVTISNVNVSAGTTSQNLSAFTFSNANNVSFGLNGSVLTASVVPPSAANINLSAGTTSNNSAAFTFSNANGVSFGLDAGTVTASVKTDYLTTAMLSNAATISNIKVSAGTQSSNLSALTFSNGGGVTFGLDAGTITATVATNYLTTAMQSNAVTISAINFSAGTTSQNLSKLTFADSNGVSFGLNGSVVTATVQTNFLTTAMQSASSSVFAKTGFTTTTVAGAVVAGTNDTNGLKLAVPGYLTTAMASNAATISAINFSAGTTSNNLSKLTFSDSNGVSFGLNGSVVTATVKTDYLTTAMASNAATLSNFNISAGTTSNNLSAVTWSNVNGVSFGLNASTMTASVAPQTNQSIGIYASSQTTGQSSSSTVDARSLTVVGMGNISAGMSAGSLVISGNGGGGGGSLNLSAGTTSNNLTAVTFSNSNGVSFGLNGSVVTASIVPGAFTASWYALGNTTQNSSSTLGAYSLNGLGALTVGYSNGSIQLSAPASSSLVGTSGISISTNGSTISVIGPTFSAVGAITLTPNGNTISVSVPAVPLLSNLEAYGGGGTVVSSIGNGTLLLEPFLLPENGSFNHLAHWCNPVAAATASHSSQSTRSNQWSMGRTYGIYSQGSGTNSTRLESVFSASVSMSGAVAYGHSSNAASATASHVVQWAGLSQIDTAGGVTYTTISGSSTATGSTNSSTSVANTFTNAMTGTKVMAVPFATSLSAGNYWLAIVGASSSTSQASNSLVMTYSNIMQTAVSGSYFPLMATATVSTRGFLLGHGLYSASTTVLPANIALTDLKAVTGQAVQPFALRNMTL